MTLISLRFFTHPAHLVLWCASLVVPGIYPLRAQQLIENKEIHQETPGPALTNTPTPTPVSAPQCVWVAAWVDCSGFFGDFPACGSSSDRLVRELADKGAISAAQSKDVPSCFSQTFQKQCLYSANAKDVYDHSRAVYTSTRVISGTKTRIIKDVLEQFREGSLYYAGACHTQSHDFFRPPNLADFLGVPLGARSNIQSSYNERGGNGAAYWYMDEACHYITTNSSTVTCGYAGTSWSPISLILDEHTSINDQMSVAEFSLTNKNSSGVFTLWKASEKAPLLVYDPEETQQVNSAYQLFGNFAFGGKRASVPTTTQTPSGIPWANGYEALELLDRNKDLKISGDELANLSLWFDENRDAITQRGEVRRLNAEGITELYYRSPSQLSDSKDLALEIGYTREVAGKTTHGRSIDWYAEQFNSKDTAQKALTAIFADAPSTVTPQHQAQDSVTEDPSNPLNFAPHISNDHLRDMSGFWIWAMREKDGYKNPGVFALEQAPTGTLTGYSVVETKLEANSLGIGSSMITIPLQGQFNTHTGVEFSLSDKASNSTATSTARLVHDGHGLIGKTTQVFNVERNGTKHSANVTYDWIAIKVAVNNGQGVPTQR